MSSHASSSRKRAASPLPDPIADLKAQKAALQERYDALKAQYKANLAYSKKTDQRLDRLEAALTARGGAPAPAAPAAAAAPPAPSVNDEEVRRLKEQNEALLKSLMASNEAAERARVAARKAEEKLAATAAAAAAAAAAARAEQEPELDEEAAAEALFRAKQNKHHVKKEGEMINICIKGYECEVYFKVMPHISFSKLGAALWARFGLDPETIRFVYQDRRCDLEDTIETLRIPEGGVIWLQRDQTGC